MAFQSWGDTLACLSGRPSRRPWDKTSAPKPRHLRVAPHPLCFAEISNHLLDEVLGFAVGVGAASSRVVLIQGQVLGVSIDGGRAAEHDVPHAVGFHGLGSRNQPPLSLRALCPPAQLRSSAGGSSRHHHTPGTGPGHGEHHRGQAAVTPEQRAWPRSPPAAGWSR